MNELSNGKENQHEVESEGVLISQLKTGVTIQNGIAATNHENTIEVIEDESNKITTRDIEDESKQVINGMKIAADSVRRVFHRFGQARFAHGGSILGLSQFTLLPQLPLKKMPSLKVVKIDSKISKLLC